MVMSTGFWLVTVAQVLRHPFGLSTATSTAFTYFQAAAVIVAIAGIWWITSVLVRVQWRGRRTRKHYFEDNGRQGPPG
jgi:ABC-type nickel/cobalt efflux system permease component RcnA